jgi:AraC family transcriptional regulator
MVKKAHQSQFHRSQIGRAQRYIRLHLAERISLSRIAREAGSSSYHFARLFQAYVGETPFAFLRRIRLVTALRMFQEDAGVSVTEIALSTGYETTAAFNKSFRKTLEIASHTHNEQNKTPQTLSSRGTLVEKPSPEACSITRLAFIQELGNGTHGR